MSPEVDKHRFFCGGPPVDGNGPDDFDRDRGRARGWVGAGLRNGAVDGDTELFCTPSGQPTKKAATVVEPTLRKFRRFNDICPVINPPFTQQMHVLHFRTKERA